MDIAHWCTFGGPPPLEFSCRLSAWHCADLSVSKGLSGTKENSRWPLVKALFNGLAQLDASLSRVPRISTSNCTSLIPLYWQWDGVQGRYVPSLNMRMKWDGCIFLVVLEESLCRMEELGLLVSLVSMKGSWLPGRWRQLQLSRLPWALPATYGTAVQSDYILGSSESPFYTLGTSPSIASVFLAGMFWKPALPAGSWHAGGLADPQVGQLLWLQEGERNDAVAQPLVWVLGAVGLFPGSAAGSQRAKLGVAL